MTDIPIDSAIRVLDLKGNELYQGPYNPFALDMLLNRYINGYYFVEVLDDVGLVRHTKVITRSEEATLDLIAH